MRKHCMKNGRTGSGKTSSWHTESHSHMVVNALHALNADPSGGVMETLRNCLGMN